MNDSADTSIKIVIDPVASQVTSPQSDVESIIQIDSYRKLAEQLSEISSQIRELHTQKASHDIHLCRKHQAIFINGRRGAGKTYFIVNLENGLKLVNQGDLLKEIEILSPIDISIFEEEERILPAVIAHILDETRDSGTNRDYHVIDSEIEKLAISLDTEASDGREYGIDTIMAHIRRNKLEQNFHSFAREVYRICNNKIILLPVDDVDTNPKMAYALAQLLRRYVSSPYIIPIVSGDLTGFGHAIHATIAQSKQYIPPHQYFKQSDDRDGKSNSTVKRSKDEDLAYQVNLLLKEACQSVIDKVFPANQRIQLSDFRSFNIADKISFKLRTRNTSDQVQDTQEITINELSAAESKLFYPNFSPSQHNFFHPWSYITNLRSFISYLSITDRTWHIRKKLEDVDKKSEEYTRLRNEILSQLRHYYRTSVNYSTSKASKAEEATNIEIFPRLRIDFTTRGAIDDLKRVDEFISLELRIGSAPIADTSKKRTISRVESVRCLWRAIVKENDPTPINKLFILGEVPDDNDKLSATMLPLLGVFWVEDLDADINVFSPIGLIPAIFMAQVDLATIPASVDTTTTTPKVTPPKDIKYRCDLEGYFTTFEIYEIFNAAYKLWLSYYVVGFERVPGPKIGNNPSKILIDFLWDVLTIVLLAVDMLEKNKQELHSNPYNYISKLHLLGSNKEPGMSIRRADLWNELLASKADNSILPMFMSQGLFSNICKLADKLANQTMGQKNTRRNKFFSQSYYKYNPNSSIESVMLDINFVRSHSRPEDEKLQYAKEVRDWLDKNVARKSQIRGLLLSLPSYQLNDMFRNKKWGLVQCKDNLTGYDPELLEEVKDYFVLRGIWT